MNIQTQDYTIHWETKQFTQLFAFLKHNQYSQLFVLTDENTVRHCLPRLEFVLQYFEYHVIVIPSGEAYKSIQTCAHIWQQLLKRDADRKSLLINIGGGVLTDIGGFCASTFKRGIDFIQIPTTLLAQVDASVGGKLGIDFGGVKNLIGVFQQPQAIFMFPPFIYTLPKRELYSGWAEMLKHGLLNDKTHWEQVQNVLQWHDQHQLAELDTAISRSILVKKTFVEQDFRDTGVRKSLNIGHTWGHALESWSWSSAYPILHGEAVVLGLIAELYLANRLLGTSLLWVERITQTLFDLYKPSGLFANIDQRSLTMDKLLPLLYQDKKNVEKKLQFALLTDFGAVQLDVDAPQADLAWSLGQLRTWLG